MRHIRSLYYCYIELFFREYGVSLGDVKQLYSQQSSVTHPLTFILGWKRKTRSHALSLCANLQPWPLQNFFFKHEHIFMTGGWGEWVSGWLSEVGWLDDDLGGWNSVLNYHSKKKCSFMYFIYIYKLPLFYGGERFNKSPNSKLNGNLMLLFFLFSEIFLIFLFFHKY